MLLYLPVIFFESLSCASIGILQGARGWRPPRFISHYIETPRSSRVSWKPI
jgi:hypothetical protein